MSDSKPTVAIIGASADPAKFGNKAVRAYLRRGWDVFPVSPKGGRIEGLPVYASLQDVPGHLNRISVYVPPAVGMTMLEAFKARGADELWINPGAESGELIQRAKALGLDPIVACSIVDIGEAT